MEKRQSKKFLKTIYNPTDEDSTIVSGVFDYIFELLLTEENTH